MSDVSFNEEPTPVASYAAGPQSQGLTGLVKKWGLAKTDKEAEYILIGVAVGAVVITGWLLFSSLAPDELPPLPPPAPGAYAPNP